MKDLLTGIGELYVESEGDADDGQDGIRKGLRVLVNGLPTERLLGKPFVL